MPFGLKNAPATFQRLMDRLKSGLGSRNVLVYLDDLLVLSSTFDEHLDDLKAVLDRLRKFGLRMNREKCRFCCQNIKYLGHILTSKGIQPDLDKTKAIREMRAPANLKQLISFLQTCSWYRRFVPNFASIAEPLTRLTRKKTTWEWSSQQQRAFDNLKEALTNAPILQTADETKPYTLRTDASGYAIGAVLLQGEKETEHPVEYASRLLSPAERNYSTTEREALAVVWAVDKFRGYIEGTDVTIASDHQPLKWLMTLKSPSGRLARWALLLQPYCPSIQYIPGRCNTVADMLSRLPIEPWDENERMDIGGIAVDMPSRGSGATREQQLKDDDLGTIIKALESTADEDAVKKWTTRGYFLNDSVLYRYAPNVDSEEAQLVVPTHERKEILRSYHDDPTAGHYGIQHTLHRIVTRYFWPGMAREIGEYVRSCIECQRYKAGNRKPAGLLQTPVMQRRFEVLAVDLFGPLPAAKRDHHWILIVENTASQWVELFPLQQTTAEACAEVLINEVLLRFGLPRRIISDNGAKFISGVMQQVAHCLGIQQTLTPVYHPEANPVERKNRDLKAQLGIYVRNDHTTWDERLPAIRFAMNSAKCESTGYTAAHLTFGRELRTPDDTTRDLRAIVAGETFLPQITPKLLALVDTLRVAQQTQEDRQDRRKQYADQRRREGPEYEPGDLVWVATHPISKQDQHYSAKLAPRRDGPYVVKRRVGVSSYELQTREAEPVVIGLHHTSALSPYTGSRDQTPAPVVPIRKRGRPRKRRLEEEAGPSSRDDFSN